MHFRGLGLTAATVTPALMNDHLTGYLLAIAVVAALAERAEKGGYWRVRHVAQSSFHDGSLVTCAGQNAFELIRFEPPVVASEPGRDAALGPPGACGTKPQRWSRHWIGSSAAHHGQN